MNRLVLRHFTPQGLVADGSGQNLHVTDQYNHQIRKVTIPAGQVITFAGTTESGFTDGIGAKARFNMPANIAIDLEDKTLYVTDASNNAIRKINVAANA
jgi:DNA-binding beta-propeller fold protein YncE